VSWMNDIQKQITVGGQKNFRGQNPDPGTSISYWLKGNADSVRIVITDITGREVRVIDGPKTAGLNRARWDMRAGPPPPRGGGAGTGQAEQPAGTAPSQQPAATNPPATPPAGGRQGAGREDRPATTAAQTPAQGAGRAGQPATPPATPPAAAAQGGGGRGRGGFAGPALAAGTYLVKITVDGKVIGTKTIVIEADSLQ
jgi:hypothetical protein